MDGWMDGRMHGIFLLLKVNEYLYTFEWNSVLDFKCSARAEKPTDKKNKSCNSSSEMHAAINRMTLVGPSTK